MSGHFELASTVDTLHAHNHATEKNSNFKLDTVYSFHGCPTPTWRGWRHAPYIRCMTRLVVTCGSCRGRAATRWSNQSGAAASGRWLLLLGVGMLVWAKQRALCTPLSASGKGIILAVTLVSQSHIFLIVSNIFPSTNKGPTSNILLVKYSP